MIKQINCLSRYGIDESYNIYRQNAQTGEYRLLEKAYSKTKEQRVRLLLDEKTMCSLKISRIVYCMNHNLDIHDKFNITHINKDNSDNRINNLSAYCKVSFKTKIDLSEFKIIPNHTKYMINKHGKVYSLKTKKILVNNTVERKYDAIQLDGAYIHTTTLLTSTFYPEFINIHVSHIDGNLKNVNLDNLSYHCRYTKPQIVRPKPVMCINDKLCFKSADEASKHYNIKRKFIYSVLGGQNYTTHKLKFKYIGIVHFEVDNML